MSWLRRVLRRMFAKRLMGPEELARLRVGIDAARKRHNVRSIMIIAIIAVLSSCSSAPQHRTVSAAIDSATNPKAEARDHARRQHEVEAFLESTDDLPIREQGVE